MNRMSDEERAAKLKEILTGDENYFRELVALETPADVQESLRGKGLEVSEEEILAMRTMLEKMAETGTSELSEEELDDVAGGFLITSLIMIGITAIPTVATVYAPIAYSIWDAVRSRW